MTNQEALDTLEEMSDGDFSAFFNNLPLRVRLCVQGGLVDWKEVLPQWYIKKEVSNGTISENHQDEEKV